MAFSSRFKWPILLLAALCLLLGAMLEASPLLAQFSFVDETSAHGYWNALASTGLTVLLAASLFFRQRAVTAALIGGIAFTRTAVGIPLVLGVFQNFSSENYSYLLTVVGISAAWIALFICALLGIRRSPSLKTLFFLPSLIYALLLLFSAVRLGLGTAFSDASAVLEKLTAVATLLLLGMRTTLDT